MSYHHPCCMYNACDFRISCVQTFPVLRLVRKPKRTASSPQEPLRPKKPPVDPPKTKKLPDPLQKGKSPEVKGEQSQLSSISGIQEKLKKRGPRSLRNKESSENKEHHTLKFWRSAPRVVSIVCYWNLVLSIVCLKICTSHSMAHDRVDHCSVAASHLKASNIP